jgi:hypothetical protein
MRRERVRNKERDAAVGGDAFAIRVTRIFLISLDNTQLTVVHQVERYQVNTLQVSAFDPSIITITGESKKNLKA